MYRRSGFFLAAMGLLAVLASTPALRAEDPKPLEVFTAFGVQMQTGMAGAVEIAIYRWSTDAEREELKAVLKAAGSPAVAAQLQQMPTVGYFKLPDTLGKTCYYAQSRDLPDGTRQVVVATDRFVAMQTISPQASQYDLSIVELRLPKSGKGEGKIVLAGKASFDKDGKVQISNYQGGPVLLKDVKSSTR